MLHAAHERFLKAASKSRSPTGDLVAGDEHGDPLGHPGAGQAAGEPPRVRGRPLFLAAQGLRSRAWSTLPIPSQSVWESPPGGDTGSDHRAGPPEGRTAPPHEAPGDRHGGGQDRRPQQQCAEPTGRAAEEAFHHPANDPARDEK